MRDVLLVSLGGTTGLREADAELAASLRRAGASVEVAAARPVREWRTMAAIELAWARSARRAAAEAGAARAVLYSSTTAALLAPRPGAIRFDAPAAGNRPGRHGLWQRPVERRRLREASLLVPWSEGGLAEAPAPHADAVVVPVPVEPSGIAGRARHRRDHLRRPPREEGPRPRARGVGRRAARRRGARGRGARRGERPLARGRGAMAAAGRGAPLRACASPARCRARSTARSCAARACSSPRRAGRTTASRSSRRSPTAARWSRPPRPGPYAALPLARALDPRLVTEDLAGALRAALDEPAPGYAERAAEALRPWAPAEVDRVVADVLLPRLLDSAR